ncbi:MAG: hypothetical protein ACK5OX_02625 [Desertimonas sp.]
MTDIEARLSATLDQRASQVLVVADLDAVVRTATAGGSRATGSRAPGPGVAGRRVPGDPLVADGAPAGRRSARRARPGVLLVGSVAATALLIAGLAIGQRRPQPPATVADASTPSPATAPADATIVAATSTVAVGVPELTRSIGDLTWPPRPLIGEGWEVVSANEDSTTDGWISFQRDGQLLVVGWARRDVAGADRALDGATKVGSATLLGEPVDVFQPAPFYDADEIRSLIADGALVGDGVLAEFAPGAQQRTPTVTASAGDSGDDRLLVGGPLLDEALADAVASGALEPVATDGPMAILNWERSSVSVQTMPIDPSSDGALDVAEFSELLEAIGSADETGWWALLPDRVVTPETRDHVVNDLLSGVPVPDDFSLVPSTGGTLVQDRLNLAGELQHRAACAWLDRYFNPTRTEDPATAVATAADALATMDEWPISAELTDGLDRLPAGVVFSGDRMSALIVGDDSIVYAATGEVLTGYFAAQLCLVDATG